jgi:hypothetical protein
MVDRVKAIEHEVEKLDKSEFERFSFWFAEYEAKLWDAQIEQDSADGKLDFLISEAKAERDSGTLTDL